MRKLSIILLASAGAVLFIGGSLLLLLYVFRLFAIDPSISQTPIRVAARAAIVAITGGGMFYWAYRLSRRREETEKQKQHEYVTSQIASLTKKSWSSNQVLIIRESAGWYIVWIMQLSLLFFGGIAFSFRGLTNLPEAQWTFLALGVFLLCMGGFLLAQRFPFIGKSIAELTANGIKTPQYGMISWSDIEGIRLDITPASKGGMHYTLVLKTNEYLKKKLFPLNKKSFGLFSSRSPLQEIRILLTPSDEFPEIIEAVARFLWTQARATELSQDEEELD